MSNRKTPILQTLPRISAIYYALLQTGYEYYPYERNAAHRAQVERFAGTGPQVPFFAAVRQNTCSADGCSGNTQGVAALCRGMKKDEAISRLEGINCNGRGTSCPDQLARALKMLQ